MNIADGPPIRAGHATMADVAERAGVSLKSVSRVINAEPHVSAKLRERVEWAITALDYVPDTAARSLAGARSFTIGVMFDNPSPNYTMKVMTGAYRACVEHSYHLRVVNLDSEVPRERLVAQVEAMLRHSRADGFILTPPLTDNPVVLEILEQRQIRYSRIAPVLDPGRSGEVCIDDAAAAAGIADLFWNLGHRRFGLVNGPTQHGASNTRREGFLARIRELGPETVVSEGYGGFSFDGGIAAGRELLGARKHPTAIFAANDDMAAGVMVACAEYGLKVPDDVSVCGFDDSWVALSVWPHLTTIYQPIEEMAHAAALMLLERGPVDAAMPQRQLDFRLIERGSVSPPK
jgi:LacI family transcriptional regulator